VWTILSASSDSDQVTTMLWPGLSSLDGEADTLSRYGFHLHADGVIGTPLPYNVKTDDGFTLLVLACFVVMAMALAAARSYLAKLTKDFFRPPYSEEQDYSTQTPPTLIVLSLVNCVLLAMGTFITLQDYDGSIVNTVSPLLAVALFTAAFILYFLIKLAAYYCVNTTFFGSKKRLQWKRSLLYIWAFEAVLLMPLVLLLVYFDTPPQKGLYYLAFVLILNKMLLFYKSYNIFFQQNRRYLQNILYFCALEIAPLLAFSGAWLAMANLFKVNF